ncbi:MAG: glycine C-acetyltransferase [Planctomycetota bacterium]|jgi:glycine C-acetyltransferase
MAFTKMKEWIQEEMANIEKGGLLKEERYILGPQGANIKVEYPMGANPEEVVNFCANNYLGLSSHPKMIKAAHQALDEYGYGLSSVRFICGTQDLHRQLEEEVAAFLGTEACILFASCLDANAAIFEVILGKGDIIIADRLVHASIVDGMKLCEADIETYKHSNMKHLEKKLQAAQEYRYRCVVTDGIFSMDGDIAKLDEICALAEKYDALVVVDDSHATGFIGKRGRGTHEHCGVMDKVDVITTTFGKAMGGATGGCIAGPREIVDLCRQRARPYLFSNTVAPLVVASTRKVISILTKSTELRDKLEWNTNYFREKMGAAGFDIKPGYAIAPIMLYNAKLAQDFAKDLYYEGIYVIGFFFPVVAQGQARIRVQLSAAHDREHLDKAIDAFIKIGKKYDILGKSKNEIIEKYGQ